MRRHLWIATLASLLLLAGALLLWRAHERWSLQKKLAHRTVTTSVHSSSTAPNLVAISTIATNAIQVAVTSAKTNPFAYRLSNTGKTIGQLANDRHAILLENELIDSSQPLNLTIPKQLQSQGDPGAYVVQAHGTINPAFRAMLADAGAEIISYIPNNAYLVRASLGVANSLAQNPNTQAVIPYEPYYKIQSSLLGAAVNQNILPSDAELTLGLFSENAQQTIAQIKKLGAQVVAQDSSPFGPIVRVQPPQNWTALATLPGVQIVEPYHPRIHANDLSRATVGVASDTQVTSNYLDLTGAGVIVDVNDSGIDANHPDFDSPTRVFGNPANLIDTDGHGTHVAGIIAGDGTESMTVTNAQGSIMPVVDKQFRGMAPLANLFSMNFTASDRKLQEAAALTNALISNNSWNYSGNNAYDLAAASYDAATRDALAFTNGSQPVLFIFSAGNDGNGNNAGGGGNPDTILSPATAKDVITVGAVEQLRDITNIVTDANSNQSAVWEPETDTGSQVAGFSARGNVGIGTEGDFGRFKPDVVAPGTFVISTRSGQWNESAYYNPTNDHVTQITDVLQPHSQTDPPLQFFVFKNAVEVDITATPTNSLPIYLWKNTANPTFAGNDSVTISGGTLSPVNAIWQCAVSNTTAGTLPYTLTVDVKTTNDLGNYYEVLSNLNNSIGGDPDSKVPPHYYRYESGTSMAAADISGTLALMQEYFTNQFQTPFRPSPALLKAMLINGARPENGYDYQVGNAINFNGWGLISLPNSLPPGETMQPGTSTGNFFVDQSPTNALATGDSHTYNLTINDTNGDAQFLPLQITLAWTDPPGNPAAAIKLVNSLELIVTDLDDPTNEVFYGNDIPAGSTYNTPESSTNTVAVDNINNVQQVIIPPLLGGNYSITVIGKAVNVNAVVEQTNNVVQDYALVISCGEGEVTNAFTITDNRIVSNPTSAQDVTFVTTTNNSPLFNQMVGANTPLLGTNQISIGTNTPWATNGLITLGMTNQWHFFVVTNPVSNAADFTNAAFITFLPDNLSIPRTGVYADSDANSTRPQADIDLYVACLQTDPNAAALTNLDTNVIASCVNGANGDAVSLTRGGEEFVTYTNSKPGDVYYIGVKSEDQMASEFAFIPIFTDIPFGQNNGNGDQIVNGLNVPVNIPDGSPAHPQTAYVFAIALQQAQIQRVILTNVVQHQNFGDLVGALSHGSGNGLDTAVVLNSHDEPQFPPPPGPYTNVYDDSGQNDIVGSQHTDGPGSLQDYVGAQGFGLWILTETDNSQTQTGTVENVSLLIQPHKDLGKGITVTISSGTWYYNYIDVPPGFTNLIVAGTNLPPDSTPPLQLYLNELTEPTFSNYLFEADLTNGTPPGNSISYGPPLPSERYWVGVFNPDTVAHDVYLLATLGGSLSAISPTETASNGPPLTLEAVTSTNIFVSATNLIASLNVGVAVAYPRISDLTFTLISPTGKRILLIENRGGPNAANAGNLLIYTNIVNSTATGGATANTNSLTVPITGTTVPITYNFYTVPDEMTIYVGSDPTTFDTNNLATFLYDTGFTNNPSLGPGAQNTSWATINVPVPPGYTNITIIMNQFGNPYGSGGDDWDYTAGAAATNYEYLMFTEDTNLATLPIKFAVPPFSFAEESSNYTLSDFELATNGDYFGPANIYDANGGWTVPTNLVTYTTVFDTTNSQFETITNTLVLTNNFVSVVTDPSDSLGDNVGSNFLALANGTITRSIPTVPGKLYNVTFWYRGPGISGWWRGEGDALDSADPERHGQNGSLIGRFDFPAGEVEQAFEMENNGGRFDFAGTNSYVQIHPNYTISSTSSNTLIQSSALDVGAGGGLTVEGWINPTNVSFQQPLVEWLAGVPTNYPAVTDTNFNIVAGPFLDRATGHYYYLLGATNWTVSESWATNLGGHLATVDTANEENWIYDTFENYAGTNRNLWIGLNDAAVPGTFVYSSGVTNYTYTDWATNQPNESCNPATEHYVAIVTATNAQSGLWVVADNNGVSCTLPPTNKIYGVVEVNDIQTNGVQFWISVTNIPGTTNGIVDGLNNLYTNGCLYADLVDTTNGDHIIFSAAGLVQSNVFQHVALTYDTNSGIANLFFNGTNVATTNFGVIIPKTTGDVLLGKDMSRLTNNFFGGLMDEMSIYGRALSDAEIAAIYNISASTTNRLIGKFDPSVTPTYGLAEASVNFDGNTNVIFGVNNQWEQNSYTFIATSNSMPLTISGLEPGMLLDQFAVSEAPVTNLYYFPEQSLDELIGDNPYGTWSLEIWDNRTDTLATTTTNMLLSWELQMVLQTNTLSPVTLSPQTPMTITVPPGQIAPLYISVPDWATVATNILDSASGSVDMLFNPANAPTGTVPPDYFFFTGTSGSYTIDDVTPTVPPLPTSPTNFYYLGIQNNGTHAVTATVEVDFNIAALTNGIPFTGTIATNQTENYFSFDVTNGFEATFQLLKLSGNADLVVRKSAPLPTLLSSDYGSFNVSNADENIYILTNSMPVPLSAGRWYLGVIKRDSGKVNYTVLAKELATNAPPAMTIISLTNGVPFNFTAGPGAVLTNFFSFLVTNTITSTVTNYVPSIHFELYHLTGNGDLTVQSNAPPFAPPFFQSSQQPGTTTEFIQIRTNSALTNLAATWFLGVPNHETNLISYTIIAFIDTNNVFPTFPGAEGAGAGALGGGSLRSPFTNNTVYHVINLNDSGSGSLRDAVSSTNRTIVFDVSGILFLQSPLVITNSYLTIAGQTASGGGVTVAGQMTKLQSVHDVVIRDVRFRSGGAGIVFSNALDQTSAADYTNNQSVAGFKVVTNQVSVVTDPVNAYHGSNFLALANGTISNNLPTLAGQIYTLSFAYRGPGIMGWWRAESNANSSVYGNNPTNVQSVTYTNGMVGKAFYYNGSSSLITMPPSTSLAVTNTTFEGWIYPTTTTPFEPVVEYGGGGQLSPAHFWVNGWGLSFVPGTIYANVRPSNPTMHSAGGIVPQNKWSHVAFTLDARTGNGFLYYNGVQVASSTATLPPFTNTFSPVNIGYRDIHSLDVFQGYRFAGGLDEISIYNRALSASEIKAIYQDSTNGKFDPVEFTNSTTLSLAKAFVTIPGVSTNTLWGNNTNWQIETVTFTAKQNGTPMQISGIEPGILLDSLSIKAGDSLQLNTVSNVIADHITAEWSTNEDLSILSSTNVTVQWSMISDSLNNLGTNGYGLVIRYGAGAVSLHHNLFTDNAYASPRLGDNISLDFVNNVIYNWGTNAGFSANDIVDNPNGFTNKLNYICNYLIASTNSLTNTIAFWSGTTNTWIYQTNNFIDSNTNHILDGANTGWNMFATNTTKFDRAFPLPPVSVDEAFLAYEKVLDFAGPDMDKRDSVDTNIVGNVRTQTGTIINSGGILSPLNSSLPYLDTDQDGIPDFWENTFGTDPFAPNPNAALDGSGYTELEEYNNWLAAPHALTTVTNSVGMDLQQMFGQTGNLSFFVTNAVNGSVYLTNVLNSVTNTGTYSNTIAIFTPTNSFNGTTTNYGYASFGVFVTNNSTVAYFGPVTVSVVVSEVPVRINSNMPPVITVLTNGMFDPTNYGGSDFYQFTITDTNAIGVEFNVMNIAPTGAADLVVAYNRLPSLSDYDYISTNSANEFVVIWTNSTPVPLTNGNWYVAVVNVNPTNGPVSYNIHASEYFSVYPPVFTYPTNGMVTNIIETVPFTLQCQATDTNSPTPLPLTFALVNQPTNVVGATNVMTINSTTGVINWTPNEAQGPSTNSISVSVSNGSYAVTNSFTIIVEESNLPPVLPSIPDEVIAAGISLTVTNTATDPDIPTNVLTYSLLVAPTNAIIGTNTGIITWTPTLAQAGTTYLFTTVVTDTNPAAAGVNSTSLSATNNFYVTVVAGSGVGTPQTNTVVAGGINWIAVNVPTNVDWATNILLFATNFPVNVLFATNFPPITNGTATLLSNATNGVSILGTNTAPTNIVMGGTYYLGVQNTNSVDVTYAFEVDFHFITTNAALTNTITISSIIATNGGYLLIWFAPSNDLFAVQETNDLTPPIAWNTFSNVVSFASPTLTNGIGLFEFFDDGSQFPFGPIRFYRLLLLQVTNTLTLPDQTNYIANVSQPLAVTNTATDSNGGASLTYVLTNFPSISTSAAIDSNGIISWTPGASNVNSEFKFITVVTDNGSPQSSASNSFTIFVVDPLLPFPSISNAITTPTNVTLQWNAPTNDLFQVEWATNLSPAVWMPFLPSPITPTNDLFMFTDTNAPFATKFYRLDWLPLP